MKTVYFFVAKTIPVADILIGKRLRQEYGDVDSLANCSSDENCNYWNQLYDEYVQDQDEPEEFNVSANRTNNRPL